MSEQQSEKFYTEISSNYSSEQNETFSSVIELNPKHKVYAGHFPHISIAPGVFLIQTVRDILVEKLNKKLILTEGSNIKFVAVINPNETKDFQIDFTVKQINDIIDVSANYTNMGNSFTKFKGKFKIVH
jgi:3-hydroxyacyl-[acyl-carrier-protein] dehydratase